MAEQHSLGLNIGEKSLGATCMNCQMVRSESRHKINKNMTGKK